MTETNRAYHFEKAEPRVSDLVHSLQQIGIHTFASSEGHSVAESGVRFNVQPYLYFEKSEIADQVCWEFQRALAKEELEFDWEISHLQQGHGSVYRLAPTNFVQKLEQEIVDKFLWWLRYRVLAAHVWPKYRKALDSDITKIVAIISDFRVL